MVDRALRRIGGRGPPGGQHRQQRGRGELARRLVRGGRRRRPAHDHLLVVVEDRDRAALSHLEGLQHGHEVVHVEVDVDHPREVAAGIAHLARHGQHPAVADARLERQSQHELRIAARLLEELAPQHAHRRARVRAVAVEHEPGGVRGPHRRRLGQALLQPAQPRGDAIFIGRAGRGELLRRGLEHQVGGLQPREVVALQVQREVLQLVSRRRVDVAAAGLQRRREERADRQQQRGHAQRQAHEAARPILDRRSAVDDRGSHPGLFCHRAGSCAWSRQVPPMVPVGVRGH